MIRLESLGRFRVFKDDEELPSLAAKPLRAALLAYLAAERQASRQRLCLLFWPDSSPERGRHALSQTLYELRKELGGAWAETEGELLSATDALSIDVSAVLEASQSGRHTDAVSAYGGPFLDGLSLAGGVDFERWVEEKRAEVHGTVRRAFRSAVEEALALDDRARLARGWVQLDPLDDEGQHALIEALALCGDRSGALEQYRVYSALIAEELEVEPLDQTKDLVERIKRGEVGAPGGGDAPPPQEGAAADHRQESEGRVSEDVILPPTLSILRLIGQGATGAVYLAREPALRRLVAVKVLSAEFATHPTARARFEREAQAAARILHPNVTTVHQVGTTDDGRPYLVMPYVKGGTLADRMKAIGSFSWEEVRRLIAEAASALAAAHRMGVVHRDVRPANFLYEEATGRTFLTDFGIAGVLESGTEEMARLTRTGELLGNVEYVSPEQAQGHTLDDRSDVYSLGILGWMLLFGAPPFATDAPADAPDPELVRLLRSATSRDPRHRPSAAALADALARPPGQEPSKHGWSWLRPFRGRRPG